MEIVSFALAAESGANYSPRACIDNEHVPTEKALQRRILVWLRLHGGWWTNVSPGPYTAAGLPDIIGCFRGRFFAIELKQPCKYHGHPEHGLTPAQALMRDGIMRAGGRYLCTDNLEDVIRMFEDTEDLSRSDDEEDARPHYDEGGDLDTMPDDEALLFNDPPTDDDDE